MTWLVPIRKIPDLTLSRPQRGLVPTLEFWNQPDRAMRPVRIAWVAWLVLIAVAGTAVGVQHTGLFVFGAVFVWFLGLGAYERVVRNELDRRRALAASPDADQSPED